MQVDGDSVSSTLRCRATRIWHPTGSLKVERAERTGDDVEITKVSTSPLVTAAYCRPMVPDVRRLRLCGIQLTRLDEPEKASLP
jgi:hypothetical protein